MLIVFGFAIALSGNAQTTTSTPHPEFESAAVKVHPMTPFTYLLKDFSHAPPFMIPKSSTFADTAHAQDLIMEAWGLSEYQILYLPWWALSQRGTVFDIEAKAKGNEIPTPTEMQLMLQAFLADKFHLKTHWETKPRFSVYALVVDKGTPKFREFNHDSTRTHLTPEGEQPFTGTTLFALARFLTQNLDLPVVDRTGLPATAYDFDIDKLVSYREIDREESTDPLQAEQYLREAVQHQLGLRLESRKESTQMLVIDHIEEPAGN